MRLPGIQRRVALGNWASQGGKNAWHMGRGCVLTSGMGRNGTVQSIERTHRLAQRLPARLFPLSCAIIAA